MPNTTWKRTGGIVCSCIAVLAPLLTLARPAAAGVDLNVITVMPPANDLAALPSGTISVTFDMGVDPTTINGSSFCVFGKWSGPVGGLYGFANGNKTVTLHPDAPLFFGEMVMVVLSHDIATPGGTTLRQAGYSWQFWTAAAPATREFSQLASMTTRTTPQVHSQAYGGIATDLDNDGWPDLTIVNEVTEDLRVFMNLADGTGAYAPFSEPTFPIGNFSSPNEPADFNSDGNADICVADQGAATVSVLLGNGDGTYAPRQVIGVGSNPRGIAVLDVDGDGDIDIVNTNNSSSNLSRLLNDGSGVFGAPVFFDGGVGDERALGAADMNEDGIMDLVVAGRNSQLVNVLTGNGNGTFTPGTPQSTGGSTWMLNCADINGDGHVDVAMANSNSNNGSIVRGDGNGGLAAPTTVVADPFAIATDLGDLDGDGDLDWVISSFQGDFFVYRNNGSGTFTFDQELNAPSTASCALVVDIDNDADMDLVLVDETADVVILQKNDGTTIPGDLDGNGVVDTVDFLALLAAWGPCPSCPPFCSGDVNFDCTVDTLDFLILLGNWTI